MKKNIVKKLSVNYSLLFVTAIVTLSGAFFVSPEFVNAQRERCNWDIALYEDGRSSPYTRRRGIGYEVLVANSTKFQLKIRGENLACNNSFFKGDLYIDNSKVGQIINQKLNGSYYPYTWDMRLGDARVGLYRYEVAELDHSLGYPNESYVLSRKTLNIYFVNKYADPVPVPGSTNNTNPGNTSINVNGTAAANVNTAVGANFNMDLDKAIGNFWNPLEGSVENVPQLITALIRILFALIGIAAVVVIIVSGFRMVMASGNEEQLTKAKKAITWAIIGLIVSLLSFSIVAIIQRLIQVGA